MRRITSRFVLLIATAAVLPLIIYGAVSINSLRTGTNASVRDGNLKVALIKHMLVNAEDGYPSVLARSRGQAEVSRFGKRDVHGRERHLDEVERLLLLEVPRLKRPRQTR